MPTQEKRALVIEIYNCIKSGHVGALEEALDKYVDRCIEQKIRGMLREGRTMRRNPMMVDVPGSEDAV